MTGYGKRGPTHGFAANQVEVQVVYRLPRMFADVKDGAVSAGFNAQFTRELRRDGKEITDVGGIGFSDLGHACDVAFGNNQDVYRGLRIHIMEGKRAVVFIGDLDGNLTLNHATEKTRGHINFLTPRMT